MKRPTCNRGPVARRRSFRRLRGLGLTTRLVFGLGLAAVSAAPSFAADTGTGPARLEVSGYGFPGNRDMKKLLRLLEPTGRAPQFYDANFIEDAALILQSQLRRDGFLQGKVTAHLTLDDGTRAVFEWAEAIEEPLPRPLRARRVHFVVHEGRRSYFRRLDFLGLTQFDPGEARAFFIETGALLPLKRHRLYTPERLRDGMGSLREALERRGFQEAKVDVESLARDERTGAVAVTLRVHEGPRHWVRSVRREVWLEDAAEPHGLEVTFNRQPYSRLWEQDFIQSIRTNYYHRGYPDVAVTVKTLRREPAGDQVLLDLLMRVKTGPQVWVGDVEFRGQENTRVEIMEQRVPLESGELLDRVKAEEGRARLGRLGIFDSVNVGYEPVGPHTRDVIYQVDEGRKFDLSLLAGYGSYELLRGGVEVERFNLFGRGHHARLRAVQSFKSTSADLDYTMPELLGRNVDVFLNASGLRREEVSFTREEFGGGAGARRYFESIASDVRLRYQYEVLNAAEFDSEFAAEGRQRANVGAVILEFTHDRRDHPLLPRRGYRVHGEVEVASQFLAGNANYQRLELAGSYHWRLGAGRWVNAGLSHGLVLTPDRTTDLPFNKRFFPGGASSVRGYQEGEAAPRDEQGKIVGAETFLLSNLEFEQALTPKWAVVLFVDAAGIARMIGEYPWDETVASAGGGLRWQTLIGPVRLEYGHNLNRRERDPAGTLHFSVGFPF